MTAVALALAVALVVVVSVGARMLAQQQRAHARRENLLVDQLLHAVGKPWSPPPAELERRAAPDGDQERTFTPTPEQEPVE